MHKSYHEMAAIPVTSTWIGTGETAIHNTVAKIKEIIISSSKKPYIRDWAEHIVAGVDVQDKFGEASAIHNFVRDSVRYTRDPLGFEYLQMPHVILEDIRLFMNGKGDRPIGDCDDMTMLSLSLLKSIGFAVAIKIASFRDDLKFSHVYGLVQIGYEWMPIDCVRPDRSLGWEGQNITRSLETIV